MISEPGIYCCKCSYNLHGLPENRCPECGRPFDPLLQRTFRRRPRRAVWAWVKRVGVLLLAVALLYGGLIGWLWRGWKGEQDAMTALGCRPPSWPDRTYQNWSIKPMATPLIARLLPDKWRYLLNRVDSIFLLGRTTDEGLKPVGRLRSLRHLAFYGSDLSDEGMAPLGKLKDLSELEIFKLRIRGPGLAYISGLKSLQVLKLESDPQDAGFDSRNLAHLSSLTNLRKLYLTGLTLHDEDLAALSHLIELRELHLYSTGVSDAALVHLGGLDRLELLDLHYVALTDRGAVQLARLSSLKELHLDCRNVQFGELGITNLQRLVHLRSVSIGFSYGSCELSPDQIQRAFPRARVDYFPFPPTTRPTTTPAPAAPASR